MLANFNGEPVQLMVLQATSPNMMSAMPMSNPTPSQGFSHGPAMGAMTHQQPMGGMMNQPHMGGMTNQPQMGWGQHHNMPYNGLPHPHLPNLPVDPKLVAQFVGGFIKGIVHEDHFKEIDACLQNGPILGQEVMEAINDFKKKDFSDILAGVQVMGKVISQLPQDLATCQSMQDDVRRITAWGEIFKHPLTLIKTVGGNIFKNLGPIGQDISKISVDIQGNQFEKTGEDMADLLILNLGPVPKLHEVQSHIAHLRNPHGSWGQHHGMGHNQHGKDKKHGKGHHNKHMHQQQMPMSQYQNQMMNNMMPQVHLVNLEAFNL